MGDKEAKRKAAFDWWIPTAVIVGVYIASVLMSQQSYLNQVEQDHAAAEARLAVVKAENEKLRQEKAALEDRVYIEKLAREELGMTKPGELPYAAAKK